MKNKFKKYQEPTVKLLLEVLNDAYNNQFILDKELSRYADAVFDELIKELKKLEKNKKIDLNTKIRLEEHPALYQSIKELEQKELQRFTEWAWIGWNVITESLQETYRTTLMKTYDIFRPSIPSAPGPHSLDVEVKIIDTYITSHYLQIPWCQDGKTYSDRLYGNVANFESKLAFVLEEGITKGKGMEWMQQAWKKLTGSAAYETARLLKTETVAMWAQATKEAYLDMGIEYVEIINPEGCEEICSEYVGEIIPLEEAKLGDELPPYHPNCVCDFIAFEEEK